MITGDIDWGIILKIAEGVSYLAGAVLVYIAWRGLAQIKNGLEQIEVTKETADVEARRDALRIANEQVASFFQLILPKYEETRHTKDEAKLIDAFRLDKKGKLDFEEAKKQMGATLAAKYDRPGGVDEYLATVAGLFQRKRTAFNLLEAFSSSFVSGLGDEQIAYLALGKAYTDMVNRYVNLIEFFNDEGYYKNITTLNRLWNKRLSKDKASREVVEAEQGILEAEQKMKRIEKIHNDSKVKLASIKNEISKIEDEKIISIGSRTPKNEKSNTRHS